MTADGDTIAAERARERAREESETARRARTAYETGTALAAVGRSEEAVPFLDRAHRLARADHAIAFALALARLRAGDPAAAAAPLLALVRDLDLRPAAVALAVARQRQGLPLQAAHHLADTLSRQTVDLGDPSFPALADAIARAAGHAGWCGLDAGGRLTLRAVGGALACVVRIDGVPLDGPPLSALPGLAATRALPPRFRAARRLEVEAPAGATLLPAAIDLASIARTDGLVSADGVGGLVGWAWCPNAPEHAPVLTVVPAGDGVVRVAITCGEPLPHAFAERRFGMIPRGFALPAARCPPGPLLVLDEAGRLLPGAPIDPGLEPRAIAARVGRGAAAQAQAARFAPVPVGFVHPDAPRDRPRRAPPRRVAVVIPVHGARRRTLACLDAVFATVPAGTAVHVVDDASPDPALGRDLDALAAAGRIRLHRDPDADPEAGGRNRGFPASANRGIAAAAPHDVVLLNSDTLPGGDWLGQLRRAAYAAPDIASATPFGSDASILGYPRPGRANPMPSADEAGRLARLAAAANGRDTVTIPVGVGFCLYLRRDALAETGPLREDVFGLGYGEENDWCLRARQRGWRHVACPGAFVAHEGGGSFRAGRAALMRRNEAILAELHPGWSEAVRAFAAADPLAASRRRLDEARLFDGAATGGGTARPAAPVRLFVTHAAGGGVERVVRERAERARREGVRPLVLRPDPEGFRNDLATLADPAAPDRYPNLRYTLPAEAPALGAVLGRLGVASVELHHLLNHHPSVPPMLEALGAPLAVFVHDYAAFCHRIALFGPERRYCGEPAREVCRSCVAELGSLLDDAADVDGLIDASARLLGAARRVVVPAADVARRMMRHFPALPAPVVEPWEEEPPPVAAPPPPREASTPGADRATVVAVPGGLGPEKGVEVLLACARDAVRRRLPLRFVVVGYTSADDALLAHGVRITGPYEADEAVPLLRASAADLAFLPSVWPETWSFVLTECRRAGLPIVAFDLGVPADRIRARGDGALLPPGLPPPAINDRIIRLVHDGFATKSGCAEV